MIVDFIYSYTTDVLRDAQAFGDTVGQTHGKVKLADVELAIHSRADMSFAQAPNLEVGSCICSDCVGALWRSASA